MVEVNRVNGVRSLVNTEKGLISRETFVSDELYQQELEQVFARTWLFIGHTSQVPNPNDFWVSRMGEESVVLTRDRQGQVHVLLNTCRHRGMKVVRYDRGNAPVFSCPYHGWSYSTDGSLVSVPGELIGVPHFASSYHGELKKEDWGLIPVPKMHIYKGSVWACWDKDAPEWDEYMGDMKIYLDMLLEGTNGDPEGRVAIPGVHKWVAPHDWKFGVENFIGDTYHGITTHRSANISGYGPRGVGGGKDYLSDATPVLTERHISLSFPQGHGVLSSLAPEDWGRDDTMVIDDNPNPVVDQYFKQAYAERVRRNGGYGPTRSGGVPSSVFPNMSFGGGGGGAVTIAVWHPAGPRQCEIWRWYLIDKDVPQSMRSLWRDESIIGSGPVGRIEKDDAENWVYATDASKGLIARRYPYNYEMGLGHSYERPDFPGARIQDITASIQRRGSLRMSEENQRGFYRRWAELMDAKDWDEIRRWDQEGRSGQ